MTEVVMPIQPECVGVVEVSGEQARAFDSAWDAALRKAAHSALCVWADHPNRRFYAPSTVSYTTSEQEFSQNMIRVALRYNLEPMMDAIMAEQATIKEDVIKHRRIVELARRTSSDPDSVFRQIPTEGG